MTMQEQNITQCSNNDVGVGDNRVKYSCKIKINWQMINFLNANLIFFWRLESMVVVPRRGISGFRHNKNYSSTEILQALAII